MTNGKLLLLAGLLGSAAAAASGDPRATADRSELAARSTGATFPCFTAAEPMPDPRDLDWTAAGQTASGIAPHSACRDLEECADAVERFCTKTGSSGEAVEISNYTCWGACSSGRLVRVFCA